MRSLLLPAGCVLLGMVVVLTLIGAFYLPYPPEALGTPYLPPCGAHPFGTDWFGRDVLSRVMAGGKISLGIAGAAVAMGGSAGLLIGALAGYYGGLLDELLMGAVNLIMALPAILMALVLLLVLGPGWYGVTAAIALFNVPYFARIVRGSFLSLRERDFVTAARAYGAGTSRIILRHLFPNALSPLLVQLTTSLSTALLVEASLSYLGLGPQPPQPSWGRMLREAQSYFSLSPWPAIFPGLVLAMAVMGLNLLGDGLQELRIQGVKSPNSRGSSPGRRWGRRLPLGGRSGRRRSGGDPG